MSYDIFGNYLQPGHCEVHPDIPQTYPCERCLYEAQQEREVQPGEPELVDPRIAMHIAMKQVFDELREEAQGALPMMDPVRSGLLDTAIDEAWKKLDAMMQEYFS